jgi:hypothetical protein
MAQQEEDLAQCQGRPAGPVEHVVILGKTGLLTQAQDSQSRRHRALARGEDRSHQQQLRFGPGLGLKRWHEGRQKVYKYSRQGKHF